MTGPLALFRKADGVGHCILQINSHSRLMPVPEVSCLASQKRSPAKNSEEPASRFFPLLNLRNVGIGLLIAGAAASGELSPEPPGRRFPGTAPARSSALSPLGHAAARRRWGAPDAPARGAAFRVRRFGAAGCARVSPQTYAPRFPASLGSPPPARNGPK